MSSSDDATRRLRSGSREPLLRAEGLSAEFPVKQGLLRRTVGRQRVLEAVDLRLRRGQILAVVGAAGAGKTTLARTIAGLLPPSAGKVLFEGKDLATLGKAEQRSALDQIRLVEPAAMAAPGALAGLQAKLLVFDEAFDAFDAAARLRLFLEIRQLQDDQGLSCLLLTRSIELAGALSDQILVLYAGQIVESGATASLLSHPQHPYTQSLLDPKLAAAASLLGSPDSAEARGPGCAFRAQCPQAFERCAAEAPTLFAVPGGLSRCFLRDPEASGA